VGLFYGLSDYADGEHPLVSGDEGQQIAGDTQLVWLHKLIWSHVSPGGGIVMPFWIDSILHPERYPYAQASAGTYRAFMADIPINNGRYVDAQPDCTDTNGLRALGQKDTASGRAHLWIDNPEHTWQWARQFPQPPDARGGVIRVGGFAPGGSYHLQWWDTGNGPYPSTETLTATGEGRLVIPVSLRTDIAVKITPE
jgi:hypothetical protein